MTTDEMDDVIKRVRELDAAATKGPWECCSHGDIVCDVAAWEVYTETGKEEPPVALTTRAPGQVVHDAALIAEYRTAAPLLAAELQSCRARIAELEAALRPFADALDPRGERDTSAFYRRGGCAIVNGEAQSYDYEITWGDIRRARAALADSGEAATASSELPGR